MRQGHRTRRYRYKGELLWSNVIAERGGVHEATLIHNIETHGVTAERAINMIKNRGGKIKKEKRGLFGRVSEEQRKELLKMDKESRKDREVLKRIKAREDFEVNKLKEAGLLKMTLAEFFDQNLWSLFIIAFILIILLRN